MEVTINQVLKAAISEQSKGNLESAERLYRSILQEQPKNPEANHNLGILIVSLSQAEAGLIFLKTALEEDPNQKQFWISYITVLIQEGNFKDAGRSLKEAKNKGFKDKKFDALELALPSTMEPAPQETNALIKSYQNRELSETVKLAMSIIKNFPNHILSWKLLGVIFGQTGQMARALFANSKVVQLDPKDADSHCNLGLALSQFNRFEESEKSCRQAIKLKSNLHRAHNNLGIALRGLGRLDEAEISYKHAIELKPNYVDAHYNLGIVMADLKRYEEAELLFDKTLKLQPDYTDALFSKGKILFDKEEFEFALESFDACNTKKSRTRSLETLYALGRIKDIYKRIELQSELDDGNISFASFSSFIEEKQKKDTAHRFCKNPMDFIYYSNISSHVKDSNLLINEIIGELTNIRTHWEPQNKSTYNGSQSILNLFDKPSEKILNLQSIITNELGLYKSKFKNKSCSYIKKWPSKENLFGWHVVLKKQGYQNLHIHENGWLSGVIYLKVVPPLEKNEGAIEFNLSGSNYFDTNSPKLVYQPNLGDIIFFPSSLFHRTIPFTTDTDRITVSFDLVPNKV